MVGQSDPSDIAHDSTATGRLDPSETEGCTWGKMTAPVTAYWPPEPAKLPTTPAGSVTAVMSAVGVEVCSPAGLLAGQLADRACHEGMVKNAQTSAIPDARPVVPKVA
jgi:hypothetical protein